MTIGFRATEHDTALIEQLRHDGETNSDVLRRALEALRRREVARQIQFESDAIVASGENLADEPDAWSDEYDIAKAREQFANRQRRGGVVSMADPE
ncbi:hypothetical protein [Nocardia yunnanensis]|uniref:hypothetical protein n=1 Tax=Nocardia yunnanensis TaxID=2382165 RepID=UPI001656BE11|nr:hypothetical protein [Nocardia yunnanensis]